MRTKQIYHDIKSLKNSKKIILLRNGYWKLLKKKMTTKKQNKISVGYFWFNF